MLPQMKFWLAALAGAVVTVGSPAGDTARAGVVAAGHTSTVTAPTSAGNERFTGTVLYDGLNRFGASATSGDPLFDGPLQDRTVRPVPGDASLFTQTARTDRGSDRAVPLDPLGHTGSDVIDMSDQRFAIDVADSFVGTDVSRFDLAGDTDPPSTASAPVGKSGQPRATQASQVTPARPLAIPLPPAVALFPLGAAAALWARRRLRRNTRG